MPSDFSQDQRDIIHAIITAELASRIQPAHDTDGSSKLPDANRTREIAEDAIEVWKRRQPRWWQIRKRMDTKVVVGFLTVILGAGGVDWAVDTIDLRESVVHSALNIESAVAGELETVFEKWQAGKSLKPTDYSGAPRAIQAALNDKMLLWSAADGPFEQKSRLVLENLARNRSHEFSELVTHTMTSQPILMFQAQATLGLKRPVEIRNKGCEDLIAHWGDALPKALPGRFQPPKRLPANPDQKMVKKFIAQQREAGKACQSSGSWTEDTHLTMPFWARFNGDMEGARDKVFLLLQVIRENNKTEPESNDPVKSISAKKLHPYEGKLDGITISYDTPGETNLISSGPIVIKGLKEVGKHFYYQRIDPLINAGMKPLGRYTVPYELMHTLEIGMPILPEKIDCDQEVADYELDAAQKPEPACLDENIVINAIVMVNREGVD